MIYEELKQEAASRASSPESMAILVSSLLDTELAAIYLSRLKAYTNLRLKIHRIRNNDSRCMERSLLKEAARDQRRILRAIRNRLGLTYSSGLRKRFF